MTLRRVLRSLVEPLCGWKAAAVTEDIREEGGLLRIRLRGVTKPLYYPAEFGRHSLNLVIAEQQYPDNWHYYEIEETRVRLGDTVVDCGAAEGLFALKVADRCERVYAVEPLPRFIEVLRVTFSDMDNVEIVPVALSDEEGVAKIQADEVHSYLKADGEGDSVRVTTLDRLFADRPVTYIKADLEGYDLKMLKGARNVIRANKPRIAITTYHSADDAPQMQQYLAEIVPAYRFKIKGVEDQAGAPAMLHAWVN